MKKKSVKSLKPECAGKASSSLVFLFFSSSSWRPEDGRGRPTTDVSPLCTHEEKKGGGEARRRKGERKLRERKRKALTIEPSFNVLL